jgi:hypothetical protein
VREWTAKDAEGVVLSTGEGADFVPAGGTVTVEVVIGGRVEIVRSL